MTTKIRGRKIEQESGSPQDNSNEMMERWKQLQIVLSRTERYREVVTGNATTERDARLLGGMQIIWLVSSIVTLFIAARIGLKLIAVNPGTPFGRFVVDLTDLLLWPFSSMTETLSAPHVTMLELSSLTAVILYPFAAWCLIRLLQHKHKA
jgi:hypothetical protein